MMNSVRLSTLALACTLTFAGAAQAGLTPMEERIVAEVKAGTPAALSVLERSVDINSGTMNHAGVRAVGALYRAQFDQLGFATRWIDMPPSVQRAGHLLAEREGRQGKRLLLIGHLDTVFEPDSPVRKWERKGERVSGQGVSDMKGGNVIILQALRALQRVGALDNTRIAVMFTGDEESAGNPKSISRRDLIAIAKRSDVALAFEGTALDDAGQATATIGRRSSTSFELDVKGRQGHSAGVFGAVGYGAIFEAARILDSFRQQAIEPDLTFNPGVILGGTDVSYDKSNSRGSAFGKSNVIANAVTVKGDIRYLDEAQRERVHTKMRAIVGASLPGTSATIRFEEGYPPMAPTAGNLRILELYSRASADVGLGPVAALPAGKRGAGDVNFVAPYVDSLDGLGATGRGAHSPDEDLELASIERAAIRTAVLIYRLTR
ncbi:MAG: M20/M25/M40 family metallo-hydrolase [Pseudomonadota bacterium]